MRTHHYGVSSSTPDLLPDTVRQQFGPAVTYLNTASVGLLPRATAAKVDESTQQFVTGEFSIPGVDEVIANCRASLGRLLGTTADRIAIGSNVSQLVGLVAESLPAGSVVLAPDDEFTSGLWPFLARHDDGITVRTVPFEKLAEAVESDVTLVVAGLVQSADGAVADGSGVVQAARACGAQVMFDVTQATGWFPVHDTGADWLIGAGYKWLVGRKGTAFLTGTDEALASLRPLAAGWYAGDVPWESTYGGPLRLAGDARRLDVSPVWSAWVGLEVSLNLIESVGIEAIHRHDVALANRLRAGLGLPAGDSAIFAVEAPPGTEERLQSAGIIAATRNGRLRLSTHLYNTEADVDHAIDALTS